MIQREEIADRPTHLFTSIMQIAFLETDKVVYKSHKGALASVKRTLLQIKIPSFPPEIEGSGLKQMSRGPQESVRDGKSPGRSKADVCHKRKQKNMESPPRWHQATETISRRVYYHSQMYK